MKIVMSTKIDVDADYTHIFQDSADPTKAFLMQKKLKILASPDQLQLSV